MIDLPKDVPEYMAPAWVACLMWAAEEPAMLAAFSQETKVPIPSRRGGIVGMIDKACGLDEVFAQKFAEWFHENVWGKESDHDAARAEAGLK